MFKRRHSLSTAEVDRESRSVARLRRQRIVTVIVLLVAAVLAVKGHNSSAAESLIEFQELRQFPANYEPSGAQQLPDGRIVMVEDESANPLSVLTLGDDGEMFVKPLKPASLFAMVTAKPRLGELNDLEGVDVGDDGYVYAITSHSRSASGKRADAREKLVRFKLDGDKIVEPGVIYDLRKLIARNDSLLKSATRVSDVKDDNGFNIEGLSFDKSKRKLLVALRSPVIDDKAVIVVLENPHTAFAKVEKLQISSEQINLDLDKGGIRAISFDPRLDGYLIVSRREDKKKQPFKLWFWDGDASHSPRRIRVEGHDDIANAEGITPVRYKGQERLLMVFDDGRASKGKGAHYLLLAYEQLMLDPEER